MNKYRNHRIKTSDGIVHDSQREAARWMQLKLLERAGVVKDLQRQVAFVLIPTQREVTFEVYKSGKNKGKLKDGKILEKQVVYIADFVYTDSSSGETVVEDTKGFRTSDYIIKRKLMLYVHGIRIREV